MSDWRKEYLKGKNDNLNEEFGSARVRLEKALSLCPDDDYISVSEIIFEIGRALFGQGIRGAAIGCLLTAVKMGVREPHARNMMQYLVNEYGMPAMDSSDRDNEEAFKSIQVMRYLESKKSKRFGTLAERDMILELVSDAWKEFSENIYLKGLSAAEKLLTFRSCVIFFPSFEVNYNREADAAKVVCADFGNNLCSCGSGLPYMWCCGRIKTLDELENGSF